MTYAAYQCHNTTEMLPTTRGQWSVLPDWAGSGRVPAQLGGFEFDCAGKYWLGRVDKIWAGFLVSLAVFKTYKLYRLIG